ncbi:SSS family solute:Na+ symporter [Mycoplasmoides fastidiosum]|uniref:SSS family solute:Na+ symporter n=1 Tax=Mycoplasmoides fastidiosum TaxID=92758 RepID=A0ABU0LYU1_9BACT|nr:SSS family solute:Na+ symporter [Mycoplasmoides fastidiosum]UUD37709.1 SSS family transporter [Mycoplasmoides fastidiosum]
MGFSIWATTLSSITYLAVPGTSFQSGWMWAFAQLTIIVLAPFLIKYIIPFFRRMKATSAYHYLEQRFHYALRAISSAFFIAFHIFRIAIVMYIPIAALSLFVDISPYLLVAIMGLVVLFSTLFGGMKGVLWSDAIQGIVLILGIALVVILGLAYTKWDAAELKYQAILNAGQWKISLTMIGIPLIFISNLFNTLYQYIGSQDVVQRYKAKENIADINRTLWINAGLGFITILLFYGAGSVLYTYYSSLNQNVDDSQAIQTITASGRNATNLLLPYFVVSVLPSGIAGLIISAVFAASQSTISSSLSSLSNSIMSDFVERWTKMSQKWSLIWSKIIVLISGLFGTALALSFVHTGIDDVINYFLGIVGLFGSPVAAVFILGIFTKRANSIGTFIGIVCSSLIVLPLWILTQSFIPPAARVGLNSSYLAIINFFATSLFGYSLSLIVELFRPRSEAYNHRITNLSWTTTTAEFREILKVEKQLSQQQSLLRRKKAVDQTQFDALKTRYEQLDQMLNQIAQTAHH